jgi:acetyl esterase/lipase
MGKLKILVLLVIILSCENEKKEKESSLQNRIAEEFTYGINSSVNQSLDYYKNENVDEDAPVLIWIHGGAWVINSKSRVSDIAFDVAEEGGYHLISVGYRFANDNNAPWPSTIIDVNTAIRWVKKEASNLSIDPEKVYLIGTSAGAHLAALSASTDKVEFEGDLYSEYDSDIQGAVLFSGVYKFNDVIEDANRDFDQNGCTLNTDILTTVAWLIDCTPASGNNPIMNCDTLELAQAGANYYIDSNSAPMLVLHGKEDCIIPWSQADSFYDKLSNAGVRSDFVLYDQGTHDPVSLTLSDSEIVQFLENQTNGKLIQ